MNPKCFRRKFPEKFECLLCVTLKVDSNEAMLETKMAETD